MAGKGLCNYLKNDPELTLIKSCVFHYEMELFEKTAYKNRTVYKKNTGHK